MPPSKHVQRLEVIYARKAQPDLPKAAREAAGNPDAVLAERTSARPKATAPVPTTTPAKKRAGGIPAYAFAPMPYDVSPRDNWGVMEFALFRLSKKELRTHSVIQYDLPEGFIQVSSGLHGMASIWDYDIILMAISHLNEAMNHYRAGQGDKPGKLFRPHVNEVLQFCKKNLGGSQKEKLIAALIRLSTTYVLIQRTRHTVTHTHGEALISFFNVVNNRHTHTLEYIEIEMANWMYEEVTKGHKPEVLTVHPDYFKISQGVGRFVYRLARKSAGKDMAVWGFNTLYEHSGSAGTLKEFSRLLRKLIRTQCLPEYDLTEEDGKTGAMMRIVHRSQAEKWVS